MCVPIILTVAVSVGIPQSSGILIETGPSIFVRRVKHAGYQHCVNNHQNLGVHSQTYEALSEDEPL